MIITLEYLAYSLSQHNYNESFDLSNATFTKNSSTVFTDTLSTKVENSYTFQQQLKTRDFFRRKVETSGSSTLKSIDLITYIILMDIP